MTEESNAEVQGTEVSAKREPGRVVYHTACPRCGGGFTIVEWGEGFSYGDCSDCDYTEEYTPTRGEGDGHEEE